MSEHEERASVLTADERRALREQVVTTLHSDADQQITLERFLPLPSHARVLDPDNFIVVGDRGTGKTAIFEFLNALEARALTWSDVQLLGVGHRSANQRWLEGFGLNRLHPQPEDILTNTGDLDVVRWWWIGHLVRRLAQWGQANRLPEPPDPARALLAMSPHELEDTWRQAHQARSTLLPWLETVDDALQARDVHLTITYDYLDRIGGGLSLDVPTRYAASLLAFWSNLGPRLRRLHAKIFIRTDLLAKAAAKRVDGSKWQTRAVDLSWSPADLYRVLLRHMATDDHLHGWLTRRPDPLEFRHHGHLGWIPSLALPGQVQVPLFPRRFAATEPSAEGPTQLALARKLAGETMGQGKRKGFTHRWMVNHIQDGKNQAVPRSLLNLVREAARISGQRSLTEPPGLQLVWPTDLERAKVPTGQHRLLELASEHPVVHRLDGLAGSTTPFNPEHVIARLSRPPEGSASDAWEQDGYGENGRGACEMLLEMGTLYQRNAPGRGKVIDVPELIRAALNIKRQGGVTRS